ncbi:hypothetical protein HDU80_004459 [Chytriomyces hyalinus]|nr:hypothetical protein HDU80_004459 [Chytriomyces hyalinus]
MKRSSTPPPQTMTKPKLDHEASSAAITSQVQIDGVQVAQFQVSKAANEPLSAAIGRIYVEINSKLSEIVAGGTVGAEEAADVGVAVGVEDEDED